MSTRRRLGYFLWSSAVSGVAAMFAALLTGEIYRLEETMTWFAKLFFGGLVMVVLWFAAVALRKLRSNYRAEERITEIVGIHPRQLPDWKWKRLAEPIALKKLSEAANSLKAAAAEEEAYLASQNPDPKKVLGYNQNIAQKKKRFWELHSLFLRFGVEIPKKSWKDWGPFSY